MRVERARTRLINDLASHGCRRQTRRVRNSTTQRQSTYHVLQANPTQSQSLVLRLPATCAVPIKTRNSSDSSDGAGCTRRTKFHPRDSALIDSGRGPRTCPIGNSHEKCPGTQTRTRRSSTYQTPNATLPSLSKEHRLDDHADLEGVLYWQ